MREFQKTIWEPSVTKDFEICREIMKQKNLKTLEIIFSELFSKH